MRIPQEWVNDTTVDIDVAPGGSVELDLTGFCGSAPGDLPPLTGPVAGVTGGSLVGPPWSEPWPVMDGLLRWSPGGGEVALTGGFAPVTGGSVVVDGGGAVVVVELRIDLASLLPPPGDVLLGDPLATVVVAPGPAGGGGPLTLGEGPAGPQLVGDGTHLELAAAPSSGPSSFVVTGGRVQVGGGVLRVGPLDPPVVYTARQAPAWADAIDQLHRGPVARQLRALAVDGEMPTAVLRRFALEGANWLSRGPFDLSGHLAVQLARLPADKRDKAAAATSAAVTLVLERLLTKPAAMSAPPP